MMGFAAGVTLLLFLAAIFGDVLCQTSGSLRLRYYYSSTYSYGRLEMYYSYQWIPFTINGFDMHEADLACKTLGYSFATRYARVDSLGYNQASTSYSIYNVRCPTTATSFSSCTYSRTSVYRHSGDVGIQCTNSRSSLRLISSSGYTAHSSGRLQISINNTWGTVCDDNFGSLEAGIACRQLGFSSYSSYSSVSNSYLYSSTISGPIWLDNLNQCSYSSTDLRSCTSAVGVNNCQHSEDIILTCSTYTPVYTVAPTASSGSLRLVSNVYSDTSGGRLEIYYYYDYGYAWRPFCSTYFNSHEADLACKKLGYLRASNYGRVGSLGYSQGSGLYSSIRSDCYSYTSRFDSCSKSIISSCSHYYDVALNCVNYVYPTDYYTQSPTPMSINSLRLVPNFYGDSSGGRLEIYYYYRYGYTWKTFCSTYFNSHEADLACKRLGYLRASNYGRVGRLGYSQGSGLYSIRSDCSSYTSRFDYCSKSITSCSHYYDVALKCVNYSSPTDYYYTDSLSSGSVAGLVIGILTLISCVFTGVTLCVVAIVVHNKKRPSQARTVSLAPNTPEVNYRMSDVTEQDNTAVSEPAPRYTPSPFTPVVFQQEVYPQNQGDVDNSGVEEDEDRDSNEEGDSQPLIIN